MEEREKKQGLSPLKLASDAGFEGRGDPMLCTQGAGGSNPPVSTTLHLERGFAFLPPPNPPKKQRLTPSRGGRCIFAEQAGGRMH
jgi:hypothetical protein